MRKIIINRDFLIKKYSNENKSANDVAGMLGINEQTVRRRLVEFNIPRRRGGAGLKSSRKINIDCNQLFQAYSIEKKTVREVARIVKVSEDTIHQRLREFNIPRRKTGLQKGQKLSLFHRQQMSNSKKGSNNPQWQGGVSYEPYGIEFNKELKEQIRKRDGYACQILDCKKRENGRKFPVHHCDYNKKNNHPENLITLCHSCHSKTNMNRNYWQEYFKDNLRNISKTNLIQEFPDAKV